VPSDDRKRRIGGALGKSAKEASDRESAQHCVTATLIVAKTEARAGEEEKSVKKETEGLESERSKEVEKRI